MDGRKFNRNNRKRRKTRPLENKSPRSKLRGIEKHFMERRHPRTFLSWFDSAHHDPEPQSNGS